MENIKFRAWNTIVKRFQYFTLKDIENQKGTIQWHILKVDRFTGMLDCNGIEIYENDLVKIKNLRPNLKIEYTNTYSEFMFIDSDDMRHTKSEDYNRTVIGNIHENKSEFKFIA